MLFFYFFQNFKNLSYDSFLTLYDNYLMINRSNIIQSINFMEDNELYVLSKQTELSYIKLLEQDLKKRKFDFETGKEIQKLHKEIDEAKEKLREVENKKKDESGRK